MRFIGALDYLFQRLSNYPGKGFDLVRAALESPVTRNRNLAIRVLHTWGTAHWPEETQAVLIQAGKVEPSINTRKNIIHVPSGERTRLTRYFHSATAGLQAGYVCCSQHKAYSVKSFIISVIFICEIKGYG